MVSRPFLPKLDAAGPVSLCRVDLKWRSSSDWFSSYDSGYSYCDGGSFGGGSFDSGGGFSDGGGGFSDGGGGGVARTFEFGGYSVQPLTD